MNRQQTAILALGRALKAARYHFVAPTPLTCGRYLARPRRDRASPLVEAFGWNRPFADHELDAPYRHLLQEADLLEPTASGEMRSRIRFSSIGELLLAHSGFPTVEPDAIFLGPDTYRFASAIGWLADSERGFAPRTIIDVGTGSGAGGLHAQSVFRCAGDILLTDINPEALAFAEVNAVLNRSNARTHRSDVLGSVDTEADLIISNPPYLIDPARRAYRHGGGDWGCALAVRILDEALGHLSKKGHLLLYTGSPVVAGTDKFFEAVQPLLQARSTRFGYREVDPDVFGEELQNAPYDQADRIATVVLHVKGADVIR